MRFGVSCSLAWWVVVNVGVGLALCWCLDLFCDVGLVVCCLLVIGLRFVCYWYLIVLVW